MVMQRLAQYQSGPPTGGGFLTGAPTASFSASASVSTGDARWTGVIVLVALVIALTGWHGLKGG